MKEIVGQLNVILQSPAYGRGDSQLLVTVKRLVEAYPEPVPCRTLGDACALPDNGVKVNPKRHRLSVSDSLKKIVAAAKTKILEDACVQLGLPGESVDIAFQRINGEPHYCLIFKEDLVPSQPLCSPKALLLIKRTKSLLQSLGELIAEIETELSPKQ